MCIRDSFISDCLGPIFAKFKSMPVAIGTRPSAGLTIETVRLVDVEEGAHASGKTDPAHQLGGRRQCFEPGRRRTGRREVRRTGLRRRLRSGRRGWVHARAWDELETGDNHGP
jgi:hypothetical protein